MAKPFNQKEIETIRNNLLTVAKQYFIQYGPLKTRIEDLTSDVGIAKGSFYRFFSSKFDLFLELYKIEREILVVELKKKFLYRKENINTLIKEYLHVLLNKLESNDILNMVFSEDIMSVLYEKGSAEQLKEFNELANNELAEIISTWEQINTNSNKSNYDAQVIAGMIRGISFLRFHKRYFTEGVYERVIDALIESISNNIS
ncbi:MAG: TetR/AcrR family transcriptional regulator [Acholeplasmataceae bacterium]|jgi:TetR/AcrR family transcriptional regulator|nr:TetR/AcrR family transcriptional regulator [Acholeplasmataceae bacterium]